MKHDDYIRFRIPYELRKKIQSASIEANESISSYIRKATLSRINDSNFETENRILEELVALRRDIGKLGNNVNQCARHLNQGGSLAAGAPEKMAAAIEQMRDRISGTLKEKQAAL